MRECCATSKRRPTAKLANRVFPLRDDNPRRSFPTACVTLIAVNVAVFLYQFALMIESPQQAEAFIYALGSVPAQISESLAGRYPMDQSLPGLLTSTFLHGGWVHLIGNMWFLWIFGDNIEDQFGHGRFVLFYLTCGVMASVIHFAFNPFSNIPAVGASGAISGVMGAYLVRFPHARVTTLVVLFIIITRVELPAGVMLAYWFLIQFVSGAGSIGAEGGGVAWWAHIGGFAVGALWMWNRRSPRRGRFQRAG